MTDDEARTVTNRGESIANGLLTGLKTVCQPHEAIVALGLAAGCVFANLELEDDVTVDDIMEDWMLAVKAQYTESKKKLQAEKSN